MFLYLSPFNFQGPVKMKTVEGLFVISFLYLDVLLWLHNTYVNADFDGARQKRKSNTMPFSERNGS